MGDVPRIFLVATHRRRHDAPVKSHGEGLGCVSDSAHCARSCPPVVGGGVTLSTEMSRASRGLVLILWGSGRGTARVGGGHVSVCLVLSQASRPVAREAWGGVTLSTERSRVSRRSMRGFWVSRRRTERVGGGHVTFCLAVTGLKASGGGSMGRCLVFDANVTRLVCDMGLGGWGSMRGLGYPGRRTARLGGTHVSLSTRSMRAWARGGSGIGRRGGDDGGGARCLVGVCVSANVSLCPGMSHVSGTAEARGDGSGTMKADWMAVGW